MPIEREKTRSTQVCSEKPLQKKRMTKEKDINDIKMFEKISVLEVVETNRNISSDDFNCCLT